MTNMLEKICNGVENFWGDKAVHELPQYKYFFVPLYKALGGKENPVFATMGTFLVSTVVHDPWIIPHLAKGELNTADYINAAIWIGSGIAISYCSSFRSLKPCCR